MRYYPLCCIVLLSALPTACGEEDPEPCGFNTLTDWSIVPRPEDGPDACLPADDEFELYFTDNPDDTLVEADFDLSVDGMDACHRVSSMKHIPDGCAVTVLCDPRTYTNDGTLETRFTISLDLVLKGDKLTGTFNGEYWWNVGGDEGSCTGSGALRTVNIP